MGRAAHSSYFAFLRQAPPISLHSAVLLLDVGFDLLVLGPLLLPPRHGTFSRRSAGQNGSGSSAKLPEHFVRTFSAFFFIVVIIRTDSLFVEEIKGLALVTGQLLQGTALLLDGRLNLRRGGVVFDVHRGLHRRLLGLPARRAKQTAETGGVRAGKWRGKERGGGGEST